MFLISVTWVDIRFPKEIIIFKNDKEFIAPENILPHTPIQWAKTRYAKSIEQNSQKRSLFNPHPFVTSEPFNSKFSRLNFDKNNWTDLKDNHLTIKMTSLLHTRCRTFDDEYKIVSFHLGVYDVEVKVICEEYNIKETYIWHSPP